MAISRNFPSDDLCFRRLRTPRRGELRSVQELIHSAGTPYFDWFFGSPALAAAAVGEWLQRPSSEISLERVSASFVRDELVGVVVALRGLELRRCRQADTLAALRAAGRTSGGRATLRRRLETARDLFTDLAADDLYLSKLAVVPRSRGRGFGRALAEEFLARGRAVGFHVFRLDVAADNEPAINLYRSLGFRVEAERTAEGLHYLSMVLEDDRR